MGYVKTFTAVTVRSVFSVLFVLLVCTACDNANIPAGNNGFDTQENTPHASVLLPNPEGNPWLSVDKPPMYWNPYEYNFEREKNKAPGSNYIPEKVWLKNIKWVKKELKPYGIDMICIDGWGNKTSNKYGYRTSHSSYWDHDYAWWAKDLEKRGMYLGIYDNPLWVETSVAEAGGKIKGTNIPLSSIFNKDQWSTFGFRWVDVTKPGAEEYIKGYVEHYANMGVQYLRVDFLSWFESGIDDNIGFVDLTNRPRWHYEAALRWMREACDEYGVFLSLVMPHLYDDAKLELEYGHLFRINEDTAEGGWHRFSGNDRGNRKSNWSQYRNPFDGLTYWSQFTGRRPGGAKLALPDADFIRLATFGDDIEGAKSIVSLVAISGSAFAVADQWNTIGDKLSLYQNAELMNLTAKEGLQAKPLSHDCDPSNTDNQIWVGQTQYGPGAGDWIVAFFNREDGIESRSINFQTTLGFTKGIVRDIWKQEDSGEQTGLSASVPVPGLSASVPVHGCKIYRIKPVTP
jgi:hypothetical protein